MKRYSIAFEFVDLIPKQLEEGKLYISTVYATASHLCCCGCGYRVSTQLSPTEWALTYDGETVSLNHSIGNWSFPCHSHYFIRRNRVDWSFPLTDAQIAKVRRGRDPSGTSSTVAQGDSLPVEVAEPRVGLRGVVARITRRLHR